LRSKTVFLVGPMGVGKSTVGPLLAERLGCAFIDTDQEIERSERRTIAEIFVENGEGYFRTRESEAIQNAAKQHAVISLGGGAIVQPGAAERLLELGIVVCLEVEVEVLLTRIGKTSSRPLLAGLDQAGRRARLRALLEERGEAYGKATHSVDASGTAEEVVDSILTALQVEPNREDEGQG
jgi:shikimate kinase